MVWSKADYPIYSGENYRKFPFTLFHKDAFKEHIMIELFQWCDDNIGGKYQNDWGCVYTDEGLFFGFNNEKDCLLFLIRFQGVH